MNLRKDIQHILFSGKRTFFCTLFLLLFITHSNAQDSGVILFNSKNADTTSFHLVSIGDRINIIFLNGAHEEEERNGFVTNISVNAFTIDSSKVITFNSIRAIGYARDVDGRKISKTIAIVAGIGATVSIGFLTYQLITKDLDTKNDASDARAAIAAAVTVPITVFFGILAADRFRMYKFDENTHFRFVCNDDYVRMKRKQFLKDIDVQIEK